MAGLSDAEIKAFAAALAASARSRSAGVSVPSGTNFGTDWSANINPVSDYNPAQIAAFKTIEGLKKVGDKVGLDTDLQGRIASIEANQIGAGLEPHHSFMGSALNRVADILSRPIYAVGAFEDEGRTANQEGAGFFGTLGAAGKGFLHGLEGKSKTDIVEMLRHQTAIDEAKKRTDGDLSDYVEKHPELENKHKWVNLVAGLAGDVAMDPLNAIFPTTAAKTVKDVPQALKSAESIGRLTEEAVKLGVVPRVEGGQHALVDASEIAKVTDEVTKEFEANHRFFTMKEIVSSLMESKKAKTGNQAKTAARKLLAKNLAERSAHVEERLRTISRTKALETMPEEERLRLLREHLNFDPENPTLSSRGALENRWTRVTRKKPAGPSYEQLAGHYRTAQATIADIAAAKRADHLENALGGPRKTEWIGLTQEETEAKIAQEVEAFRADAAPRWESKSHAIARQVIADKNAQRATGEVENAVEAVDHSAALAKAQAERHRLTVEIDRLTGYKKRKMQGKQLRKLENMRQTLAATIAEEKRLKKLIDSPTGEKDVLRKSDSLAEMEKRGDVTLEGGRVNISESMVRDWQVIEGRTFDQAYIYFKNRLNDMMRIDAEAFKAVKSHPAMDTRKFSKEFNKALGAHRRWLSQMGLPEKYLFKTSIPGSVRVAYRQKFIDKAVSMRISDTEKRVLAKHAKPAAVEDISELSVVDEAKRQNFVAQNLDDDARKFEETLRERVTKERQKYHAKLQEHKEKVQKRADAIEFETADELDKAVRRNLTPQVVKRIAIAFPYTERVVTIPGSGRVLVASDRALKADNVYNRLFRASAGTPSEINARRLMYTGRAQFRIQKQNQLLFDTMKDVSKQDAKRAAIAWRDDLGIDLANGDGVFIVKFFENQLKSIEDDIVRVLGPEAPIEINRFSPAQLKIFGGEKTFHAWTDADRTALRDNWLSDQLKVIIKRQIESPNALDTHTEFLNDMSRIVGSMRAAAEQAMTHKLMRDDYVANFGHSVRYKMVTKMVKNPKTGEMERKTVNEYDAVTKSLEKQGYGPVSLAQKGVASHTPKDMEDIWFHPDVRKGIEQVYKIISNDRIIKDYIDAYDNALRIWKTAITRYNPGYHERNLFGELFTAWLGGVTDPRLFGKAIKVLRQHDTTGLFNPAVAHATTMNKRAKRIANALADDPVAAAQEAARIMEPGEHATQAIITLRNGKKLTIDEVYHMFTQEAGLHTGFLASDVSVGASAGKFGPIGRALGSVNRKVQGMTEGIEDSVRLMHFMDALQKSKLTHNYKAMVQEAAAEVRKFHHDFTDFTDFERNIMSRAFPFYKWTRKNLPLMAQTLFTQPGKADKLFTLPMGLAIGLGFEREDGARIPVGGPLTPGWLQDNGAIPVGHAGNGNVRMLDMPLPLLDALKTGNHPWETAAFMAAPPAKWLLEKPTGHTVGGIPIKGWQSYLASQSPYSNLGLKALQGGDQNGQGLSTNLIQFLTGIGLQENTDARMMSEAIRQAGIASAQRKKAEEKRNVRR